MLLGLCSYIRRLFLNKALYELEQNIFYNYFQILKILLATFVKSPNIKFFRSTYFPIVM
jgi:hypothetical protein